MAADRDSGSEKRLVARFEDPITLPGKKITTLRDAIAWLAKPVPQSETNMPQVQAAAFCVTQAAENNEPMQFARIGIMHAVNRHLPPPPIDPPRKHHWGKRKLKRDP